MNYKSNFHTRIKEIREELGLTQEQVSAETGLTRSKISDYENGKLEPNLTQLGILTEFYKIKTGWLLGLDTKE